MRPHVPEAKIEPSQVMTVAKKGTVNAPNSDAPSSGQALISEQFLGDQFFYLVKSSQ